VKYRTYSIAIVSGDGLKFLTVVAVDIPAAVADIQEAYAQPEIVCITQVTQ
jgi:hypothetical protein